MSTEGKSKSALTNAAREADLLRHAADVVIELAIDGRIAYVSDSVENVLARNAASFVGKGFLEVIVPEDRAHSLAIFQKVITTGAEPVVRFRVLRSDGLRVELEATLRTFESEGRRRIVAVARDITQQSAEIAVTRQRDDYYRTIVESGGRPAAIVGRGGAILFSNRHFKSVFGRDISLDDIFARMSSDVRHTMETTWFESNRPDQRGDGAGDFVYEHDDGSESWYAATWEPFQNDEGQRNFSVVYEDISARKQIEFALRSIAQGIANEGRQTLERNLELISDALRFDRLVLAQIDENEPGIATVLSGWQNGKRLESKSFALGTLPDATVAEGEPCVFASGLSQLVPEVASRFDADYECYSGLPLRRADGTVIGLIGGYGRHPIVDADLTRSLLAAFATHAASAVDRRRADAEIRANQARFDVLANQADEILLEIGLNGRVTFASEASLHVLGYTPEEMIGKLIPDLIHPEDRPANHIAQETLFGDDDSGYTVAISRIRHADGSWRWLESRTSAFEHADGSRRALIISRDVSDRRHKELGQDLLYRVVQEGADLIFVCEPDATLLFANDAAQRTLSGYLRRAEEPGRSSETASHAENTENAEDENDTTTATTTSTARTAEFVPDRANASSGFAEFDTVEGHRLDEYLDAPDAKRFITQILPNLTPSKPWSGELHLYDPSTDEAIPTEATVFRFLGDGLNAGSYLAVTLRDIEARRSAEEALRQSELRLSQAQKMEAVGRLAGGIAHDFNNLLTAIIGYSDLVIDELDDGHVARRDAEEILRAAERAGGLTRQLLAFSRRQVLQPEPVDLNAVVADIDRMMRRLIGENIELVTLQDGELAPIIADPGQIEQVIVNLVVNARDAMPRGGRLDLETGNHTVDRDRRTDSGTLRPGDYAVLRVTDTGMGMDDETRSQIFEPFFTTKETHQGTGLGLASVYGIVSQSGGQIDVESRPGAGTRFSIYFPVATEEEAKQTSDEGTIEHAHGNETILLVEDAAPVRRLVQRTLEKSGYTVLAAESATGALRHCGRHQGPIDLLLCDVVLPKTAGPEIARKAKEIRPGLRVLFMSGFTDDTLARHGLDPSKERLLEKPFTPATVLGRVRALLDDGAEDADG